MPLRHYALVLNRHFNGSGDSGSRWQPRKILNSSPPTDTVYSYIWNTFLENKQKQNLTGRLSNDYTLGKWEENHIKAINPPLLWWNHKKTRRNQEKTQNPDLLPDELRVQKPHHASQLLRPAPERRTLKTSNFENQWGSSLNTYKIAAIWDRVIKRPMRLALPIWDPSSETTNGTQVVLRSPICLYESIDLRGRHLI